MTHSDKERIGIDAQVAHIALAENTNIIKYENVALATNANTIISFMVSSGIKHIEDNFKKTE